MARLNIQHDVTLEDVVHIVAIHVNDVTSLLILIWPDKHLVIYLH